MKIQLCICEFKFKKTYGLMLPGAGWQTCRWRICESKEEHYTRSRIHTHTQKYI